MPPALEVETRPKEVRSSDNRCGGRTGGVDWLWRTVLPATSTHVKRRALGLSKHVNHVAPEEGGEPERSSWLGLGSELALGVGFGLGL